MQRSVWVAGIACLAVLAGCVASGSSSQEPLETLGPLAEAYRQEHGVVSTRGEWVEKAQTTPALIGMAIERSSCYGTCSQYTVAFNGAGESCYCGHAHVEKIGTYEGSIDPEIVRVAAQAAQSSVLFELAPGYYTFSTDRPSVFSFLRIDDQILFAENYDVSGPWSLWAYEQLVDGLWHHTDWKKSSTQDCAVCVEKVLGAEWSTALDLLKVTKE